MLKSEEEKKHPHTHTQTINAYTIQFQYFFQQAFTKYNLEKTKLIHSEN